MPPARRSTTRLRTRCVWRIGRRISDTHAGNESTAVCDALPRVLDPLAGARVDAAAPVTPAGHRPLVLLLCADDPAEPWIHGIIDGINGVISSDQSARPEFYFEFLDRLRLDGARHQQLARDAILTKYSDAPFELIVVVQREAFAFATSVRDAMRPDVPILFASYGGSTGPATHLRGGDTALTFESNFEAILETAKSLFPDTRNVALVWESSDLNRDRAAAHDCGSRRCRPAGRCRRAAGKSRLAAV